MRKPFHTYSVYVLTNKPRGTFYIGVTSWLKVRVEKHRKGEAEWTSSEGATWRVGAIEIYFE